jgi:hypothetical protein
MQQQPQPGCHPPTEVILPTTLLPAALPLPCPAATSLSDRSTECLAASTDSTRAHTACGWQQGCGRCCLATASSPQHAYGTLAHRLRPLQILSL